MIEKSTLFIEVKGTIIAMPSAALKRFLSGLIRGELTTFDLTLALIRRTWIELQSRYNFYVGKFRFIDRLKGYHLTVIVISGKYPSIWNATLERLYAYSGEADVIIVNPDGLHGRTLEKLCEAYNFSYFEGSTKNFEAAQNYVCTFIIDSPLVLKMDDDVFLTEKTIPSLLSAYIRLKSVGHDIGFLAPILNVNNVTYFHFLKTLNLDDEYAQRFEKPIFTRHWTRQRIWWDPAAAQWVWERSLPLNTVADVIEERNRGKHDLIPVRFSISCILFERRIIASSRGLLAYNRATGRYEGRGDSIGRIASPMIPIGDEAFMNYYTNDRMCGRFIALDSFAGHLCYGPQATTMLRWFENNKARLLEDVRR
ncbi:MAG: hypothetical protein QXZ31_06520 [Thermofilaceae archaeon]